MQKDVIFNLDCLNGMRRMPDNSVDCCVTSPPYYGLRDYGSPDQIGLEETPDEFVEKLVSVFEEVRRVLKPEGTLWLNLGDTYAGSGRGGHGKNDYSKGSVSSQSIQNKMTAGKIRTPDHLKSKDLIGIPWMVAFALRSAGWYLRQDIIWHKPGVMPESVTDRCTKNHEYIFLLSKSSKYYFDANSISEPVAASTIKDRVDTGKFRPERGFPGQASSGCGRLGDKDFRNKRSVWSVTTKPFKEAHFATFPEDLIVDCIKAGCPGGGVVLDPFMGAGTTGLVAKKLDRHYIGFELNPEYVKIAEKRISHQIGLFA